MSIIDTRPARINDINKKLQGNIHPCEAIPLLNERHRLTQELEAVVAELRNIARPWTYVGPAADFVPTPTQKESQTATLPE